jgi:S1-C subfamily serine protease
VIVALGEHKVATGDDLHAALRGRKAGEEVELKVVREGKALALAVKLGGARG